VRPNVSFQSFGVIVQFNSEELSIEFKDKRDIKTLKGVSSSMAPIVFCKNFIRSALLQCCQVNSSTFSSISGGFQHMLLYNTDHRLVRCIMIKENFVFSCLRHQYLSNRLLGFILHIVLRFIFDIDEVFLIICCFDYNCFLILFL